MRLPYTCLFQYRGGKSKVAHLYPAPIGGLIVEPFAGGAMYSLRHCERDVLLNEINPKIAALWRWLISAPLDEVLSLSYPNLSRRASA